MNPVTFLTSTEAAAIVGVTNRTLLTWYKQGRPDKLQPQARTTAGLILFDERQVREYAKTLNETGRSAA